MRRRVVLVFAAVGFFYGLWTAYWLAAMKTYDPDASFWAIFELAVLRHWWMPLAASAAGALSSLMLFSRKVIERWKNPMALEYCLVGALTSFLAYLMTSAVAAIEVWIRTQEIDRALSAWAAFSFPIGLIMLVPLAVLGSVTGAIAYYLTRPFNRGVQATPLGGAPDAGR